MSIEIESMLVLSTGHLLKNTAATLNEEAEELPPFCNIEWGPAFHREEGWLFHVPPRTADGFLDMPLDAPVDLRRVLAFAQEHGCAWVLFDCDGAQIEGLPFKEW